jgi:hypothetical protein
MKTKGTWGRKGKVRIIVTDIRTGNQRVVKGDNTINGVGLNMVRDAFNGTVTDIKIKYLAWFNGAGTEFGRKQITSYDVTTNYQLLTTTYIAPEEGNTEAIATLGWFAGAAATATAGTGVEVARFAFAHTKTNLESIQVERTEILAEVP